MRGALVVVVAMVALGAASFALAGVRGSSPVDVTFSGKGNLDTTAFSTPVVETLTWSWQADPSAVAWPQFSIDDVAASTRLVGWNLGYGNTTTNYQASIQLAAGSHQFRVFSTGSWTIHVFGTATTTTPSTTTTTTSTSPAGADVTAPVVKAYATHGKRGKMVKLMFDMSDDSGQATPVIFVSLGFTDVLKHTGHAAANGSYYHPWIPRKAGLYSFCVDAFDAAANIGKESCAPVRITR